MTRLRCRWQPVVALLSAAGAAAAIPFPPGIDAESLDGAHGFTIHGIDALDQTGISIAPAGDINGDTWDDLIIGAYRADPGSVPSAGEAYIVFGGPGIAPLGALELANLNGTNGFLVAGLASEDRTGCSVAGIGDVNGDGFADIAIGAYGANAPSRADAGAVYIVFGHAGIGASGAVDLGALDGDSGFIVRGAASGDRCGFSVAAAGDVNNDGAPDVIIGAPMADIAGRTDAGAAYVLFGGENIGSTGVIDLATLDPAEGFAVHGALAEDHAGWSVAGEADLNDDGIADFAIGARYADPLGQAGAGTTSIVFGAPALGASGTIELAALDGTSGITVQGAAPGDRSGCALASLGDINGDGIDDLLIGSYLSDFAGMSDAGGGFIVYGGPTLAAAGAALPLWSIDGSNGFIVIGRAIAATTGRACAAVGDLNGDGAPDLALGAPLVYRDGHFGVGEAYAVFGGASIASLGYIGVGTLDGATGFTVRGEAYKHYCGTSVSSAGDINGDGIDDLAIGAIGNGPGAVHIIYGRSPACAGDVSGDGFTNAADFVILSGSFGASVTPNTNGDLNGDGLVNASDFVVLAGDFGCEE